MRHVINSCTDPHFNLALEEFFLKHSPVADDLVILWRNAPTVVIGRNQNAHAEINQPFIRSNNINVLRRLSGGGAVYHDLGNLNFTFITTPQSISRHDFSTFTIPIIKTLASLGVQADFTGRNDLTIAGQKFCGNAQYIYQGRLLHHGTLLFDTDLTALSQALSGPQTKYKSPAVPSTRSRVTTIRPYIKQTVTLADFEDLLLTTIFQHENVSYDRYELSSADCHSIDLLASSRYQDPIWNFGTPPSYNRSITQKFIGGTIEVLLHVQYGTISHATFYGDFFSNGNMDELATTLCGTAFTQESVATILRSWLAKHPIRDISLDDLLSCFFSSPQQK